MTTFDQVVPTIQAALSQCDVAKLASISPLVFNRDLNSRVRIIAREDIGSDPAATELLAKISEYLREQLGSHFVQASSSILFEPNIETAWADSPRYLVPGYSDVWVVDRVVSGADWTHVQPEAKQAARIVFFSIKGGVGRSTALAATAWALAQAGKRVLVVDLDLESPGLSSNLLPEDRRPSYGITDWLVEDLLENGDAVLEGMVATSDLSRDGEIYVVPAHGREPGEYVAKLGRVWMSRRIDGGKLQSWSGRLERLMSSLEERVRPDVILIDSRAGIDEVAASSVTQLGANLVLLFAIDGSQTWTGYKILFRHWNMAGVARGMRERLQIVGAMIPEDEGRVSYFESLREHAWVAFSEIYDEIPAGFSSAELFNYDEKDESAPHYPWPIRWNRSFAAVQSLHARLDRVDADAVRSIFGELIDGVGAAVSGEGVSYE